MIITYLAGITVSGRAYRVDHAPDGPSSPVWLSDDAVTGLTCSCGCGLALVDFEDDDFGGDGLTCLYCGAALGFEEDSDFCSEDCAQAHMYAIMF